MSASTSPNVLLVVLDSVRARNLSLYGHENDTTPFLAEFAGDATVFTQARSPGTWSLPSHVSMFTGAEVVSHGITSISHRLSPGHTFFDTLRAAGYATGAFSENPFITQADTGLADPFDHVEGPRNRLFEAGLDPTEFTLEAGYGQYLAFVKRCLRHDHPLKSLSNGVYTKLAWDFPHLVPWAVNASTPGHVYTDLFLDWIDDQERWAACINYMDAHHPYEPQPRHDRWGGKQVRRLQSAADDQVWEFLGERRPWWQLRAIESLYDGTIHQVDAQLRRLVEGLAERDQLDDTLVIITSDHGEGFGEPGHCFPLRAVGHGPGIHEPLVHVPLVVKDPGQRAGRVVPEPASITRVPDAVAAAREGQSVEAAFTQGPVVSANLGVNESGLRKAERYAIDPDSLTGESRAVYTAAEDGVDKFVTWRSTAATVRVVDARTAFKTADSDQGRVDQTFSELAAVDVRAEQAAEVDELTRQRLAHLGYR